jgi:N-methylhydantoinase B
VRRYELTGSGAGDGEWRGGLGSIRDIEFLADGGFSLEGDGNSVPPPGLFGGGEGTPGSVVMNPGTADERSLPSKLPYTRVSAGEVLRLVGPCGGGYGDPGRRDPGARGRDAADGFETASK